MGSFGGAKHTTWIILKLLLGIYNLSVSKIVISARNYYSNWWHHCWPFVAKIKCASMSEYLQVGIHNSNRKWNALNKAIALLSRGWHTEYLLLLPLPGFSSSLLFVDRLSACNKVKTAENKQFALDSNKNDKIHVDIVSMGSPIIIMYVRKQSRLITTWSSMKPSTDYSWTCATKWMVGCDAQTVGP